MPKHDCGVALYPPPEVGGFTATEDKIRTGIYFGDWDWGVDLTVWLVCISDSHER